MATLHIRSMKCHLALPALGTGALTSALMHPSTRGTCVPRAGLLRCAPTTTVPLFIRQSTCPIYLLLHPGKSHLLFPALAALNYCTLFHDALTLQSTHTPTPTSTNPHSTGTHPLTSSASTILLITMYSRFYLILFFNIACFFLPPPPPRSLPSPLIS